MSTNYNEYFERYAGLVNNDPLPLALEKNLEEFMRITSAIGEEKSTYRYADDKWSVKELMGHIIDTERIFAYRALRFARNDATALAGYDEKHFAAFSGADERSFMNMVAEFELTRRSNMAMFSAFDSEMLQRSGRANGIAIDVTTLGYLLAGHCKHHLNILEERYL